MSIPYAMAMYKSKSKMRPNVLIGGISDSFSSSSRNVQGYPTLIVKSMFPDMSFENGNWNAAIIRTSIKIAPKIAPILFVGINCSGIALPII